MRRRDPRTRLALAVAIAACITALGGCGTNGAGDVRLRAASMVAVDDDMRMHYDTTSSLRNAPP